MLQTGHTNLCTNGNPVYVPVLIFPVILLSLMSILKWVSIAPASSKTRFVGYGLNLSCLQFIIFEFEQNSIRTISDKKHSYKGHIYQLQQHAYFENLNYKVSWISNYRFPVLDHITQLIPKLSKACYVLRCIRPFMSLEALKSVYHSYFHSLLSYGIILGGNSSYSLHIFRLQKKAVRVIMGLGPRNSCRKPFKHLRILPLQSQYIFSLAGANNPGPARRRYLRFPGRSA